MKSPAPELPRVSAGALGLFAIYTRWYVRRHFHAVRILQNGLPQVSDGPLVIYLNHAAWWDPLVCLLLAQEFLADRRSFAPIDAAMLERYGFFKKLGFFGIEAESRRGARTFLQTSRALLANPGNVLWLTPQGRFTDVRERPISLQPGLTALTGATFLPLAIEYSFWTEPQPEILTAFGSPVRDPQALAPALEAAQNELAACSMRRDLGDWRLLNRGRSGVSLPYDAWRWLRARLRGEKFSPAHASP